MLLYAFVFYGLLLLVALGVSWRWGDFTRWFPEKTLAATAGDLGLGLLIGLLLVWGSIWITKNTRWGKALADEFADLLGPLRWWEVAGLAFLSGICEEALFRAALMPHVGLIWSSVLFGMVHVGPRKHFWGWTVFALGFGFLVGGLMQWRGGLLLPAVIHITVNFCNLTWISRKYAHQGGEPPAWQNQDLHAD